MLFGVACNANLEDVLQGIAEFQLTKKRMEIIRKNEITYINDSYNASYDSMKAGIEYLKSVNSKRKIAVLGDMLELGDFAKELHEKVGEDVAKNKIDVLVTVGENAKYIASKARELGMENVSEFMDNESASNFLKTILQPHDAILFKASNSMKFGQIIEKIM